MHTQGLPPDTPAIPTNPAITEMAGPSPENCDGDFWYALIPDTEAAPFLDLKPRGLEAMRSRGGGPKFVRVSSRCVRYRRIDLKEWADGLLRASTADIGQEAA